MPSLPRGITFLTLTIAISCKATHTETNPTTPLPNQPDPYIAWKKAEDAGWLALRHAAYCIRLPEEMEALCLVGVNVDRCAYVFRDNNSVKFSVTAMPPGVAMSSPNEFVLPDGSIAPQSEVFQGFIGGETSWEVKTFQENVGMFREVHITPKMYPLWLLVQYEGLSITEAEIADKAIATLLAPGQGPKTNGEPACPVTRKKGRN